jgi:glycosyltransferase involved in cell wall biosynthesis
MKVTVAICTWNRAKLLERTLAQMERMQIPQGQDWELLVVDNNSTDGTSAVMRQFVGRLPIHALLERRQGHSHARNCALAAATGDLIVWTDDDVLVGEHWLTAYVAAAQKCATAGYFGGMIVPDFEAPPPAWLTANLGLLSGLLVIRDFGTVRRVLSDGEVPYGANMAFRTSVLRVHRFDPNLGRNGHQGTLGDDTELIAILRSEGVCGVWVPEAVVKHHVPRERMTRRYLWDYFCGIGQTDVRIHRALATSGGTQWRGAPRWMYRKRWELLLSAHWQRLRGDHAWVATYSRAARLQGVILERRRQATQLNEPACVAS